MTESLNADPLPTVPESQARGEIAALYADVRGTLGVGVVNLIWRHFATFPGALAWAWEGVRPIYATGAASAQARGLREAVAGPDVEPVGPEVLARAGLSDDDLRTVDAVFRTYARGNGANLVALTALALWLRGERPRDRDVVAPGASSAPPALGPIPSIPAIPAIAGETAERVLALNRLGALDGGAVVASLYRHLGHWPALLGVMYERLEPLDRDGSLPAFRDAIAAAGEVRSRALLGALSVSAAPAPETGAAVGQAIERFRVNLIARMVAVGALSQRLLGLDVD